MDLEVLSALNSPSYSPTFGVLHTIPSSVDADRSPVPLQHVLLNRYPTQLSDVVSDLCDVAIRHNQRLRHDVLLTSHMTDDSVDLVSDQIRVRSDFQAICRGLWSRQKTTATDLGPKTESFATFIGTYLARIDAAFSKMHIASRRDSYSSIDSEMEAIALEGISDRYERRDSPKVSPTTGFESLPTETVWKIFRYLEPVYLPANNLAIQNYRKDLSMFSQLSLVSKAWRESNIPSLYRCIVMSNDPNRLDKLLQALKLHGTSVRVIIIDDIDIGPVHIRTCTYYIDKCLLFCTNLLHLQCNGDIELGSRMHYLPSLALTFPPALPVDLQAAFRFAGPDLEHLELSKWSPQGDQSSVVIPSTLPQLRKIRVSDSGVGLDPLTRLLESATREGGNVLQELSIINISSLDGPSILQLLSVNRLSKHITVLRVRLHPRCQILSGNDLPKDILPLCPSLIEFSYTSPSSAEVFPHLPQSLRILELAILLPHREVASKTPNLSVPATSMSSVKPFIEYIRSSASHNIQRLSIVRQVFDFSSVSTRTWRRLGVQAWDPQNELWGLCEKRNIQLDCTFAMDVSQIKW